MNKILIAVITILTVAGLLLGSGCTPATGPTPEPTPTPTPAPAEPMVLDIGIATPLTGQTADIGAQMQNAVLLAIKDQNDQGGVTIAGQKYTLNSIISDTKNDTQVGKTVAEELIYSKKVKVIFGPAIEDAIGAQPVTEANKVVGIFLQPITPAMCNPDKPYTFFVGGAILQSYNVVVAYIPEYYPEAKTVLSILPDAIDAPVFLGPAEAMCKYYGLQWLGAEKFPIGTRDFSSIITRALAKNPDIIDTASIGGMMGPLVADLARQIREAGYKGIIMIPTTPSLGAMEQIIPEQYRTNIVVSEMNPESPLLPDSYREMGSRYTAMFEKPADHNIICKMYTVSKSFFELLNGQETMDTTAWMNAFAEKRWTAIWGQETFFIGKPIWGINRVVLGPRFVSEYIDGKLETREVTLPMDLYYAK